MDAAAELGRNPVKKHKIRPEYGDEQVDIQPEYGDEQADAGQDCRNRIARLNSQTQTGTGKD